jgi:hypothetical protein
MGRGVLLQVTRLIWKERENNLEAIESSSDEIKFYFEVLDLSLDCIFEGGGCVVNEIYVSGGEIEKEEEEEEIIIGEDNIICGVTSDDPCKNIEYVLNERVMNEGDIHIYILNGIYPLKEHNFVLWDNFTLYLEGVCLLLSFSVINIIIVVRFSFFFRNQHRCIPYYISQHRCIEFVLVIFIYV